MLVSVVGIHTLKKGYLLHCLRERKPTDTFKGYSTLVAYTSVPHEEGDDIDVICRKTDKGEYKYFERR